MPVVVAGCQENESFRKVLNLLKWLDDRIRCTHEDSILLVCVRMPVCKCSLTALRTICILRY